MANSNGLTEIDGNFKTEARLVASNVEENSLVFIDGASHTVDPNNKGGGTLLDNTLFANAAASPKRIPISAALTIVKGFDYFATTNSTIAMPNVTGFTGGERFTIAAAITATLSTLTVDGTQSEEIAPRNGDPTDTSFDLTTVGVSFEFIFNAVTGNWEV